MPFLLGLHDVKHGRQMNPADRGGRETVESDGSTISCWECRCKIPVRAPLYGEDANKATDEKVKYASICLTLL